ncbi:hypothetical protein AbraIFM66951_006930 [Aspergillus brasiliensis]|uniref:Cyclin N-terminal domain-containing protein n=1 Tax=Aspergillus brasiliensis TaxID=319629 RepID=A0A9W5YLT1_9EURO|nr:hypothetical protein AbraCBS73388_010851 [Aspergillus brasiliensis]GKZ44674.1 hypothetical protein AbraIFM66951_006930 [Aspergillus brasiliensis]
MDAKPQRIRVRGDENAPFPLAANKTLTQKNKSTPALSTMFHNGANKNAAKRAAFGDVSNTAKPIHAGRDDISLAGKKQTKGAEKAALIVEKKPSALAQPAQRPMSMAGMKGLLNNISNAKPIEPSKQIAMQQQTANARKILSKRATVFKDASESSNNKCEITSKETTTELDEGDNKSSIAQASAAAKRTTTEEATHEESKPVLENADDNSIVDSEVDEAEKALLEVDDDHCKVQDHSEDSKPRELPAAPEVPEPNRVAKAHRDSASTSHAPAQSEPEDWDEEDEHEEEDGYITARSYRSRGDNTTGGATTVLFPKFTQQVRRELALAEQVVEATRTEEDIEDEWYDTSMVAEYSEEIFEYMREQEIKMLPNAHYMDNQAEIQWSMRSVLMDWVVQVHYRFSLLPETLFLCVNYIDRFLSCKIVSLGKLQLVGATAIFIAAKYEEINCPSVQEIVYMVDGGYKMDEILKAERFMLSMLQFELGWPGPMSFLRRISKADDYDLETRTLAKYFLEITVMDERFVGSPASFVAAGAHCLARLMLRKGTWTPAHAHYAGYTYTQLLPLISLMVECCENPRKHHGSIYEKFSDKRYKRASLFVENEMRKGFIIPEQARESSYSDRNASVESTHYWKRV